MEYQDKGWMYRKYNTEGLSQSDIADICGVSQSCIHKWMLNHKIAARRGNESQAGSRNGAWVDMPFKEKSVFEHDYVTLGMSIKEMAEKYGVAKRTIARWRINHCIAVPDDGRNTKKRKRGRENKRYKHGRGGKPKDCEVCGAPIMACSRVCHKCYDKSGDKNPNYKGNADLMSLVRTWTYNNWRKDVFERDGYTCRHCGDDSGGNLNAHHIERLADIVHELTVGMPVDSDQDRVHAAQEAISHPRVRSIDNGITLCESCHAIAHGYNKSDLRVQG